MSSPGKQGSDGGIPTWPFLVGLTMIGLATAFNIGAGEVTSRELANLPPSLAAAYERFGAQPVTLIFILLALMVMFFGTLLTSSRREKRDRQVKSLAVNDAIAGRVQLQSSEYLR
jgi:hypothetical protein